jgi:two-component system, sensor histidine kinase LadS
MFGSFSWCAMRFFYLCVCLVASLWLLPAVANVPNIPPAPIALTQLGSSLGAPHLTIRENVPRNRSIESIVDGEAPFTQTFDPSISYAFGEQSATWLRFQVLADGKPHPAGWTLELPKPYIQHVEFYQKTADGTWQMQVAGVGIANAQWPLPGLYPKFALPVMQHNVPLHFSVGLQRADLASQRSQHTFLLGGLLLGVCALMLAFSGVLKFSTGQNVYAWYALFVALSCLATTTNMGLANYALWPHATGWPEYSIYCLVMVAITAQLQFCGAIFLPRKQRSWLRTLLWTAIATNIAAVCLYLHSDDPIHRQILYAFAVCLCIVLALILVARALRRGDRTAWIWFIAYVPLIIFVGLASLDSFGFAINGMPYHGPAYALLFEVSVLLIALYQHAKSQQARQVRRSVLDSFDPHTGFVTPRNYSATAQAMWEQARQNKWGLALAYVSATSDGALAEQAIVRLLRTVTREEDAVAHVDKNLYAMLMPGQFVGTDLTNRLSRLVALGRMAVKDLAANGPVQFRIVASSNAAFGGTWQQLDASLRKKLFDANGWSRKSIRYVRLRGPNESEPESDLVGLSQMWDLARAESARLDAVKS